VRLFVDEDLSPTLIGAAHACGIDATGSRDRDMLGAPDRRIAALCLDEDRVLVTNNARDFLALYAAREAHSGLVLLPAVPRLRQQEMLDAAIEHAASAARQAGVEPRTFMVNRVIEVDAEGRVDDFVFPK
jgi:predicted nuclease of predicted toxin-antitoxin system